MADTAVSVAAAKEEKQEKDRKEKKSEGKVERKKEKEKCEEKAVESRVVTKAEPTDVAAKEPKAAEKDAQEERGSKVAEGDNTAEEREDEVIAALGVADYPDRPHLALAVREPGRPLAEHHDDTPLIAVCDTGASVSVIRAAVVRRAGYRVHELKSAVKVVGGETQVVGVTYLTPTVAGVRGGAGWAEALGVQPFIVVDGDLTGVDVLLGWNVMSSAGIQLLAGEPVARIPSRGITLPLLTAVQLVQLRRAHGPQHAQASSVAAPAGSVVLLAASAAELSRDLDAGAARTQIEATQWAAALSLGATTATGTLKSSPWYDTFENFGTLPAAAAVQTLHALCREAAAEARRRGTSVNTPTTEVDPAIEEADRATVAAAELEFKKRHAARELYRASTLEQQKLRAKEVFEQFAKENEDEALRAQEVEAEKIDAWLAPSLQRLVSLAQEVSSGDKLPQFLGDQVWALDAAQCRQLADELSRVTSLFYSPLVVPRARGAKPMPFRCTLELSGEEKPTTEGLNRSYNAEKVAEMQKQLFAMARAGVCEPADATSKWAHGCVLARKSDGSWRFCVDYRPVNAQLRVEQHGIPHVEDVCELLAREGGVYTKMDMTSAYWQCPMEKDSRHFTTFYVPGRGLWQMRVLAFGVASAVAYFQRTMEAILAPVLNRGAVVYLDDVILYARTPTELLALTMKVHALLMAYDLRLSLTKCTLFASEVPVLGRLVRRGEVREDPEHLRAVREWPRPVTAADMARFRGMAGWHRRAIPRFAQLVRPLIDMEVEVAGGPACKSSKQRLVWNEEREAAFDKLRVALTSDLVTAVPAENELDGRLVIMSDAHGAGEASDGGVGGLLYWRDDSGNLKLVSAFSRALRGGEKGYAAPQFECLALVETIRFNQEWLSHARDVTALVDHKPLVYMLKLRDHPTGLLARWAVWVSSFDIKVVYQPGEKHVQPDALSRAPLPDGRVPTWSGRKLAELSLHSPDVDEVLVAAVAAVTPGVVEKTTPAEPDVRRSVIWHQIKSEVEQGNEYDVVYADPPFRFAGDLCRIPYATMTKDDLKRLPVGQLTGSKRNAVLLMWAPGALVPDAVDVMTAWGFKYVTAIWTWDKGRSNPGHYSNVEQEFVLMGKKGSAAALSVSGATDQIIREKLEENAPHSAKPDAIYTNIFAQFPGTRVVELFARRTVDGVRALGDQVGLRGHLSLAGVTTRKQKAEAAGSPLEREEEKEVAKPLSEKKEKKSKPQGAERKQKEKKEELEPEDVPEPRQPPAMDAVVKTAEETKTNELRKLALSYWTDPVCRVTMLRLLQFDACAEEARKLPPTQAAAVTKLIHKQVTMERLPVEQAVLDEFLQLFPQYRSVVTPRKLELPVLCVPLPGARKHAQVVPVAARELRLALVTLAHVQEAGHLSKLYVVERLRDQGWFLPSVSEHLGEALSRCSVCAARKGHPAQKWRGSASSEARVVPMGFNHVVHMDYVKVSAAEGDALLFITDEFSGWPEAVLLSDQSAENTAQAFFNEWVARHGAPEMLSTDQGANFMSKLMRHTAKALGVKQLKTTPYHPQADGQNERMHKTFADVVATSVSQLGLQPCEWVRTIPLALYFIRSTVRRATGMSPAEAAFGQPLPPLTNVPSPLARRLLDERVLEVQEWTAWTGSVRGVVDEVVADKRQRLWDAADRILTVLRENLDEVDRCGTRKESDGPLAGVKVGDYVALWEGQRLRADDLVLNWKFEPERWSSPWRVVQIIRGVSVLVAFGPDPLKLRRVAGNYVKKISIEKERVEELDKLFEITAKFKEKEAEQARIQADDSVKWNYPEGADGGEQFVLKKIIGYRREGGVPQVRCRWKDNNESSWEPLSVISMDAPELWAEFKKKNNKNDVKKESKARKMKC